MYLLQRFLQLAPAFTLRKLGFAPIALGSGNPFALVAQGSFGALQPRQSFVHRLLGSTNFLAPGFDGFLGGELALVFRLFLGHHVFQTDINLSLALLKALEHLRQLQGLDLNGVAALLQLVERGTCGLQRALSVAQTRFDLGETRLFLFDARIQSIDGFT